MSDQPLPSAYQPPGYCPRCDYPTDWGTCPECGVFFNNRQLRAAPHSWIRRHRVAVSVMVALGLSSLLFVVSRPTLVPHFPTSCLLALQSSTLAPAGPATKELEIRFLAGELSEDQKVRFLKRRVQSNPKVIWVLDPYGWCDGEYRDQTTYTLLVMPRGLIMKGRVQSRSLVVDFELTDFWANGERIQAIDDSVNLPRELEPVETVEFTGQIRVRDIQTNNLAASWTIQKCVLDAKLVSIVPCWSLREFPPGREDLLFPYGRSPRPKFPPDRIGEPD